MLPPALTRRARRFPLPEVPNFQVQCEQEIVHEQCKSGDCTSVRAAEKDRKIFDTYCCTSGR